MSITTPGTDQPTGQGTITIPAGVTVQPGRQTSISTGQGQVIQGMQYGIVLANGTASSVFIPASAEADPKQVQAIFDAKLQALSLIPVS